MTKKPRNINSPIYGFLKKFDLTQTRLASLMEVSQATVANWEKTGAYLSGINKIKLDAMNKAFTDDPLLLLRPDDEIRKIVYERSN